jgi:peptide/nickel transport system permease protein
VPVAHELLANLPATARLASLGFGLAVILAVTLAFLATLTPFAWLRGAIQSIPSLFVSIPVFWLGIMLIQIFSFRLKWISVINPGELEGLILPVLTLAIPISAPLAQILMRNIDEVSTQPFVSVARAKGASPSWVLWKHVAKNAPLPTLTIAGILFGELLAGAVITETVFGLNGIGGLTERSVRFQDTSVIQAVVVFSAAAFVLVNLTVDLLYPVFDPRLRKSIGVKA